jgi:hypothetical protein
MWAARSAVQGAVVNSSYVYGNNISFRDITSGNNGAPALPGYDLVTRSREVDRLSGLREHSFARRGRFGASAVRRMLGRQPRLRKAGPGG